MKRSCITLPASSLCLAAAIFLVLPVLAQQNQSSNDGIVDDWTHHHVVFSNPGSLENAINNGTSERWERIVSSPRYRMQWMKRNVVQPAPAAAHLNDFFGSQGDDGNRPSSEHGRKKSGKDNQTLEGLWTIALGASGSGPAIDMYPAKYTFAPIGTPNCTSDFVVFPVSIAGAANSEANIIGVNNLYVGTCTGTVPNYLFSYFIGTGRVTTSPVLSEDGTKVAFVESVAGGSKFHVLTIGTTGTNAGTSGAPVVPCTVNGTVSCTTDNAVDTNIVMSGSVMDTRSSPFVDYTDDVAYVADDTGVLHKFTGVFKGTPAEVTTGGWPFTVASGVVLSDPTYDSVSGNIFVGGSNGDLYCVTSAGAACTNPSVIVGTGPILDAPIVDSTRGTVFAIANTSSNAVLAQTTTAMGAPIILNIGMNGTDLYDGAFDNAYYSSGPGSGHMYVCGNLTTAATPELWQIGFSSAGAMTSATQIFQLVASGNTGTGNDCTPLTEVYNPGQGHDYLFVGVKNNGFNMGTPNCSTTTCIVNFDLGTTTVLATTMTLSGAGGVGTSGMIMDNVSTATGGSQIYFGAINSGRGEQASQATLH